MIHYFFCRKMVKLWIQRVCAILFFIQAVESLSITICEHSELGYANITCPKDETISLKAVTYGDFLCQDIPNSDTCHSTIKTYFTAHCIGQNNCTIPVYVMSSTSCLRPPRHLRVIFKCDTFWWLGTHATVDTCANRLAKVKCHSSFRIKIENVKSYSDNSGCANIDTFSAKRRLISLCNEKARCVPDTTRQSSLFHERYAIFSYLCKEPTAPRTTERIHPIASDSDKEKDMTTISAEYATEKCTERSRKCVANLTLVNFSSSVGSGSLIFGVAVGIPVAILVVICIIVVIMIIRRRYTCINADKDNKESFTTKVEENRNQAIESYECTNVARRLSDHTYNLLGVVQLDDRSMDINSQHENREYLTDNTKKKKIQETGVYENTNVGSKISYHTYDPLKSDF